MNLLNNIFTVGGFTLLSRIFGFIRDLMMARYLGAGMAMDVFAIAFKLPSFFRRLFAEGAFSVAFVPLFSRALGKEVTEESQAAATAFAGRVLSWFLPILLVFLALMEAAMVPIMLGLSGGFDGNQEKFDFLVELGRYAVQIDAYAGIGGHGKVRLPYASDVHRGRGFVAGIGG